MVLIRLTAIEFVICINLIFSWFDIVVNLLGIHSSKLKLWGVANSISNTTWLLPTSGRLYGRLFVLWETTIIVKAGSYNSIMHPDDNIGHRYKKYWYWNILVSFCSGSVNLVTEVSRGSKILFLPTFLFFISFVRYWWDENTIKIVRRKIQSGNPILYPYPFLRFCE